MSDLRQLASALWNARVNGSIVEPPSDAISLSDAYTGQRELINKSGHRQIGWKIGSTSKVAQARLGTDQPGAGPLLEPLVYPNRSHVSIHPAHDVSVEVEFAFVMAETLPPQTDPYTRDEVLEATGEFIPGIELVGSRFAGGLSTIGRSLITLDGGGNVGFVFGDANPHWTAQALPNQACSLTINGTSVAQGRGADALGDPINVLVWLANHLSARNMDLERGHMITTGTCTGLVAINKGDHVCGDFGSLGQVEFYVE